MPTPLKVIKSFYIKGVKFEINLDEYVSIRKHQRDFSMDEHLFQTRSLEMPEYTSKEKDIIAAWENVKPITAIQALKKLKKTC